MSGAFHRAIHIASDARQVIVELEDDMHRMRLHLFHDKTCISRIEGEILRAPWSTCPGAELQLRSSFEGIPLEEAARAGERKQNCTHLFDIAVLAAAHAGEVSKTFYDLRVSDPVDGSRDLTLDRNGKREMHWIERDGTFASPAEIAGRSFLQLGDWISGLGKAEAEMARLLRGASIVSLGRVIPMELQSDARKVPANCHTFQPGNREQARRISGIYDFTEAMDCPLGWLRG